VEIAIDYLKENWVWVTVVVLAVIGAMSLIKTILKWVIIFVIIIGSLVYGLNYAPSEVKDIGQQVVDVTARKALATFMSNTSGAVYTQKENGEYTITIKTATLKGKIGEKTAKLKVAGQEFNVEVTAVVDEFISRLKENAGK
jgi:hypothetical protein